MSKVAKAITGMAVFGLWGPWLLYVWLVPDQAPGWAQTPIFRKVFMLDRHTFEPTFFTLLFGLTFTGIVVFGVIRGLQGKAHFQQ